MVTKVSPSLILMQAEQLQDIELTAQRCEELAVEVGNYNRAIVSAAAELEFDHDPAAFGKALLQLRSRMDHE